SLRQRSQPFLDEAQRELEAFAVRGQVRPAACAGGMGEWDDRNPVELVAKADALGELREAEQAAERETADGHDHPWAEQFELPVPPELAELLLARRRRAVAAAGRCPAGIAARDRGAVERRIERILVQLEPAAERPAGTAAPGQPLLALDDARRLSVHIGALICERRAHGQRLERVARLGARTAAREVALKRGEGAIARLADGHARYRESGMRGLF